MNAFKLRRFHALVILQCVRWYSKYTINYRQLEQMMAERGVHGQQIVDDEVSLYYLANEVATTYHEMMIAIPEEEWDVFYHMSASDMAVTLLDLAKRVNIRALRKSPRGPKKPRPERDGNAKQGHVSTAKLLMARHG